MTPTALLTDLRTRGFTLAVTGGALAVRPASALTPADRAAIARHLPAVVAALASGNRPPVAEWDDRDAVRLLADADRLVERLGVNGTHPDVAGAAEVVCAAYAARDADALWPAVAAFERVVRRLAGHAGGRGKAGQPPLA